MLQRVMCSDVYKLRAGRGRVDKRSAMYDTAASTTAEQRPPEPVAWRTQKCSGAITFNHSPVHFNCFINL